MNALRFDLRIPQFMPTVRERFKVEGGKLFTYAKLPGKRFAKWYELDRFHFVDQIWRYCDSLDLGVMRIEAEAIADELMKEGTK